ncbi:MAG: PPOX class F420-dependent oxidoreductase [Acidimicrobiia bacterium]
MIPTSHEDILEGAGFGHVATIGPRGEPQCNPVWYHWDGKHLRFSQTTTRQKLANLHRDSRIAISILDPDDPYRYLEVRGQMIEVEDDPDFEFIDRMAKKYLGRDDYPWRRHIDHRVVVVVEAEHTTFMGEAPPPSGVA